MRLIIYLIGIFLCSISFTIIIINLNLLVYGWSFIEYIIYLLSNVEFYYFILGIILIKKR
jgi:hypothetical protein